MTPTVVRARNFDRIQSRDVGRVILDALAAACAEAGRFDEAVQWQKKALEDAAFAKASGEAARERLRLYEARKPYRDEKK